MTFKEWWAGLRSDMVPKSNVLEPMARQAWDAATQAEQNRCAKIAETWCDPAQSGMKEKYPDLTGCDVAISESQTCTAPAGIAAAIRNHEPAPVAPTKG